jgi:glycosyltransferase involved in cell wall biosynthesis
MLDIRWFAPNRYCTLPVPRLREAGLQIATSGDAPARIVFAADGVCAVEAWRHAWRHRAPLALYLWDLPPWQVGRGGPNPVIPFRGRLFKVPRPFGAYRERNGYFSRQRFVARHAAAVWVPSSASQQDVGRVFGVAAELVPFCFDSDRFNRGAGWQEPSGVPVILAISRLTPPKNHAAILRAVALLPHPVRVHIIGRGPEGPTLRRIAKRLGLDLRLDDDAWQSDEQVVAAYRAASVVVSLSRFEGFGLTPLEASAMGIPAVASDIPPHREFADRGVELVPLDDDQAAARAIDRVLRGDGGLPRAYRTIPELTIEACAERMLPKLQRLLEIAPLGFEPRFTAPKAAVLPLDEGAPTGES